MFCPNCSSLMYPKGEIFFCRKCGYSTERLDSIKKHILSKKHLQKNIKNQKCEKFAKMTEKFAKMTENSQKYICQICKKKYKYQSGLSRHMTNIHKKIENLLIIQNPNTNDLLVPYLKSNGLNIYKHQHWQIK